jgi:hypothetical protein
MKHLILTACAFLFTVMTAGAQSPFISELMVGHDGTYCDGFGDDPDWLEIFNPTDAPVDLAGWALSDTPKKAPGKWRFPPNTVIQPRSRLVVFFETKNAANRKRTDGTDLHTSFRLNSVVGEDIVLLTPKLVEAHRVAFGPQKRNVSIGTSDPFEPLVPQQWPTPGLPNDAPQPPSRCRGGRG